MKRRRCDPRDDKRIFVEQVVCRVSGVHQVLSKLTPGCVYVFVFERIM